MGTQEIGARPHRRERPGSRCGAAQAATCSCEKCGAAARFEACSIANLRGVKPRSKNALCIVSPSSSHTTGKWRPAISGTRREQNLPSIGCHGEGLARAALLDRDRSDGAADTDDEVDLAVALAPAEDLACAARRRVREVRADGGLHEASPEGAGAMHRRRRQAGLRAVISAVLRTCSFGIEPRCRISAPANFCRLRACRRLQAARHKCASVVALPASGSCPIILVHERICPEWRQPSSKGRRSKAGLSTRDSSSTSRAIVVSISGSTT